jgi:hypothetical protein
VTRETQTGPIVLGHVSRVGAESEPETLQGYLAAEQSRLGLDDERFAALLGVEVEAWREINGGARSWPASVLARVLLRFPDAQPLAAAEVRRRVAPGDGWRWWHAA